MKVLFSIKPEFANKIFRGEKKFEYRKVIFKNQDIKTIIVYSTMPVGRIIGEFTIKKVHKDKPCAIWSKTQAHSGIDECFYNQYFEGREQAFAIEILSFICYDIPINPKDIFDNFTAPQSFTYIKDYDSILARKKQMLIT